MATRPELHIAVAKKKSKASDYNENFSMMMDYVEAVALEDKNYVDGFMPTITGQNGKFLTNNGSVASWISLTGLIFYFGGSSAPTGFLVCDGSEVSRTTYANLFSVIGTNFGEGDGSTTFNLPDLMDRFAQGSTTVGTEKEAGLPQHKHNLNVQYTRHGEAGGGGVINWCNGDWDVTYVGNPLSSEAVENAIYGNSDTVQPPALTLLPVIKY